MTSSHPLAFAPPPADLSKRQLPLRSFSDGLFRVHKTSRDAIFASHAWLRFSSDSLPFGVCYASPSLLGAFAESCLEFVPSPGTFAASAKTVFAMSYSPITVGGPLTLVDLTSPQLASIGTTALINSTGEYEITQAWAHAFFDHPDHTDGIYYLANHAGSHHSVALFDRALPTLTPQPSTAFSDDHSTLNGLLAQLHAPMLP